jgi:hypothetical protein
MKSQTYFKEIYLYELVQTTYFDSIMSRRSEISDGTLGPGWEHKLVFNQSVFMNETVQISTSNMVPNLSNLTYSLKSEEMALK